MGYGRNRQVPTIIYLFNNDIIDANQTYCSLLCMSGDNMSGAKNKRPPTVAVHDRNLVSFVNHPSHIPIGPARKIVTAPEKQLYNRFVSEISLCKVHLVVPATATLVTQSHSQLTILLRLR